MTSGTHVKVWTPDVIAGVLDAHRFVYANEDDLQAGITAVLTAAGGDVRREVRLNARDRIDLLIGRVGIEIKVAGAWRDVERQLHRYLESPLIDAVLLVTAKANHRRITQGEIGPLTDGWRKRLCVHQLTTSGL